MEEMKEEFYRLWRKYNGHYNNRVHKAARGRIAIWEFLSKALHQVREQTLEEVEKVINKWGDCGACMLEEELKAKLQSLKK